MRISYEQPTEELRHNSYWETNIKVLPEWATYIKLNKQMLQDEQRTEMQMQMYAHD